MTSPSTNPTRATTAQADQAVQTLLTLDHVARYSVLARVIAATLHEGYETALETFATTGQLNAEAVLDDLDRIQVPLEEEAWVDALARYVLFTGGGRS